MTERCIYDFGFSGARRKGGLWLAYCASVLMFAVAATGSAQAAEPLASDWQAKPKSKIRLVAGGTGDPQRRATYAGIEITLEPGWKTYWRVPGDAGVPPSFDWAASRNLSKAEVLYPAPRRYSDSSGDVIGYKGNVIFPVALTPTDPTKPIELAVALEIGVCELICIPIEAKLALQVGAGAAAVALDRSFAAALAAVPRRDEHRRPDDPRIVAKIANLKTSKPDLILDLAFPAGAKGADLFIEGADGGYVPLPRLVGKAPDGGLRYTVDLSNGVDLKDIDGKPLRLTIVSDTSATETTWTPR